MLADCIIMITSPVAQSSQSKDDAQITQQTISQLSEENSKLRIALASILRAHRYTDVTAEVERLVSQDFSVRGKADLESTLDDSVCGSVAHDSNANEEETSGLIQQDDSGGEVSGAGSRRPRVHHVCRVCGQTFTHRRPFKRHLLEHGGSAVSCRHCRLTFPNPACLSQHRCRVPHACVHCARAFSNLKMLNHHTRHMHHGKPKPKYFCVECNRGFVKPASLNHHYRSHEDATACLRCDFRASSTADLEIHMHTHDVKPQHTCEKCSATFRREQQLNHHLKAHSEHDCMQCDMVFSTKRDSDRHQRLHHNTASTPNMAMHPCPQCERVFNRPSLLRDHIDSHSGVKRYECEVCHIALSTSKALTRHCASASHCLKAGSAPKVHLCTVCGRTYPSERAFKRHSLTHTAVDKHTCTQCPYTTTGQSSLRLHLARHHNSQRIYACGTCDASFRTQSTLNTHVLHHHTHARAYACTECECTFKTRGLLRRHAATHSDDKRHGCAHCDMRFHRLNNLKRHATTVHDSTPDSQGTD